MASKPKELSNLQRDLLHLALQGPKAKIWLPKASQQSFPTTYAAIVSLQKRGLLDTEPVKDPDILSWKVTKEGRDALKAPKPEPLPVKPAATPVAAPSAGKGKAAPVPAKTPVKPTAPPPAAKAATPAKGSAGGKATPKDAAPAAKPSRSPRQAPVTEAPRERGGKGQKAAPAAGRNAGKKPPPAARKSGGRGRT
jgi:hypothetical protein